MDLIGIACQRAEAPEVLIMPQRLPLYQTLDALRVPSNSILFARMDASRTEANIRLKTRPDRSRPANQSVSDYGAEEGNQPNQTRR